MILFFIISVTILLFILKNKSTVIIAQDEVGVVFKDMPFDLFGRSLPAHQKIALNGELGYQPDLLQQGDHYWYWPWIYTIEKHPVIRIPPGEIGLVVATDGEPCPPSRQLGQVVDRCDFQDARAFLANGGQKGPQLGILTAGEYRINRALFDVITCANAEEYGEKPEGLKVFKIEPDKIGIVTTHDGSPLPPGEIAARCVSRHHNNFQNPQKFIDDGGYKGLQEEILTAGSYHLNPWFVSIEKEFLTYVPSGTVGVVVSHVGQEPKTLDGLVELGYKGIWNIPLEPRMHPVNTRVQDVILVPTNPIALDWSEEVKDEKNYDANLKPLILRSQDGFEFEIEVTEVIRIPPENAPKMVAKIGSYKAEAIEKINNKDSENVRYDSIRNLVTKVLKPSIGNYFRNSAQNYNALDFHKKRGEIQMQANTDISNALSEHGVHTEDTLINNIDLPDDLEDILQNEATQVKRQKIEKKEAEHEREVAQINAKTKEFENQLIITQDEKLMEIRVKEIQALVETLGRDGYIDVERFKNLKDIDLPDIVSGQSGFFDVMMAQMFGIQLGKPASQEQPPSLTQHKIDEFVENLGGYLKDGGAEKVREAVSSIFSNNYTSLPAETHPFEQELPMEETIKPKGSNIIPTENNIPFSNVEVSTSNEKKHSEEFFDANDDKNIYIQPLTKKLSLSRWGVAGASVRGQEHIEIGGICQDAHAYHILNRDTIVIAIADGLNFQPKANIGPKTAVKTVVRILNKLQNEPTIQDEWLALIRNIFVETCLALEDIAQNQNATIGTVSTTLVVAILTKEWLVTGHIGDGGIVANLENGQLLTISPPQRMKFNNQTNPLSQAILDQHAQFTATTTKTHSIALFSDGLQELILNNTNYKPRYRFLIPFLRKSSDIHNNSDSYQTSQDIALFLMSQRISAKAKDDKTLVIAGRSLN